MSRIDDIFRSLREARQPGLMPFVTAGYPSLDATAEIVPAIVDAGADIIELGIPFSDPIADGPVIAQSMHEALKAGVTPTQVFDLVQKIRPVVSCGLIAMVSNSIVWRMGGETFVRDAAHAGFDGLIVPDIDVNDADILVRAADEHDVSLTLLVAPSTSDARLHEIVRLCRGFVYALARMGITGETARAPNAQALVQRIRRTTDLPIAVGFGISTAEHVRSVTTGPDAADAAIVGSALVRRLSDAPDPIEAARTFVSELHAACRPGRPQA